MLYKVIFIIVSFISAFQVADSPVASEDSVVDYKESTKYVDKSIMKLSIPKIGISNKIYSKESIENDIDKNVIIMKDSDMPDDVNGNVILGGHSGIGRVAYFKNLNLLDYDDSIFIEYKEKIYEYKVVSKYLDTKNGSIVISRNLNFNSITLFTCMPGDANNYLVIIGNLV